MKRWISGNVQHQLWINVILGLNLLLSLAYGVVNPLFEAPDEHHHYFTAQWIADHGRLPSVPQPARERFFIPAQESDWLGQEAAQPPLYYLLTSLIIAPFDTAEAHAQTIHNPFVRLGDPAVRVNVNAFAHGHDGWPWRGHVLAAHLLRALSAVMGTLAVWLIYQSGRLLWPDQLGRALLAAGTVAFLPQFTFQFSAISNDTLVTLLSTWALLQLLQVADYKLLVPWWRWLLLSITIGLTLLTKNQGLLLLIFASGFIVLKGIRYQVADSGAKKPAKFSSLSLIPYP
ncbi:MAG: glycosyltransferase family 39 protein, partial [Anaerolineales bacterium]|nr:glycosyltransferase family 39 protein [Anaerolineales bacterium]